MAEQCVVISNFRVQYHYRHRYAGITQIHGFIGDSHGKICRALVLESLGEFIASGTVSRCFYHGNNSCRGLQLCSENIEVMYHGIQVDFKNSLVLPGFEHFGYLLGVVIFSTLDKYE